MLTHEQIPGWFDFDDLYSEIAADAAPGAVLVEVGVWQGRSILYLAQEARRLAKQLKIVAVDYFNFNLSDPALYSIPAVEDGNFLNLFLENARAAAR